MKALLVLGGSLAVACGPTTEAGPRYALRDVVGPAVASAEARVETGAPLPTPDAETVEHVVGLLTMLAETAGSTNRSHGGMAEIALEELAGLGERATAVCVGVLEDASAPEATRIAAARGLGALGTPAAADALCRSLESAPEAWLRLRCAAALSEAGVDHVLPRVLLRLKYEKDGRTVIELADAAAALGNLAGLDGLEVLAASGATVEERSWAAARLQALAEAAGLPDGAALHERWNSSAAAELDHPGPSDALVLETWRRIALLAEWNLRTVDDCRFVLSRMNAWAAGLLAEALHDRNVYVRLHAAQCLERMGPRAESLAGAALVGALEEPQVAAAAALALGALKHAPALDALVGCLAATHDVELRIAAARALGTLGDPAALRPLQGLLDGETAVDLRQAAAAALLALGESGAPARFLRDCLTDAFADRGAAEDALDLWLHGLEPPEAEPVRTAWDALQPADGVIPTAEEAETRQRERATVLAPLLD